MTTTMTRWTTKLAVPALALALGGCADFVDEDGNTSFRQVAEGLQSLGDRVAEMGEALERDADVEAVPWAELRQVIPDDVGDARRLETEGDDARDRNGAGMSIAAAKYEIDGDSVFVGVADLGALRGGAQLALRWVAPLFAQRDLDGDVEELTIDGYPAIRVFDDGSRDAGARIRRDGRRSRDGGVLIALLVEDRFAVVAGASDPRHEDLVYDALDEIDYRQLRRWEDYGTR